VNDLQIWKIQIAVESINPVLWCVRYGNKWVVVKDVFCKVPLRTKSNKIAPHVVFEGKGRLKIVNGIAYVWIGYGTFQNAQEIGR
jgi:hypothetical protein